MKQYKKTLAGSFLAVVIGTSCCWVTSLLIWVGGVTLSGVAIKYVEDLQVLLLGLAFILFVTSIYLYLRRKRKSR